MDQEYLIVAIIPEPFHAPLSELRAKHDSWTRDSLPPHITIIRPLRELPEGLRAQTDALNYPFRIIWQDWQAFRNAETSVVWIDPGQDGPRRVAERLNADFPELRELDNGRYMPGQPPIYHVTVAGHIPDDQFSSVWNTLRQHRITGSCSVERLSVYVRDLPDGHWKLIE